MSSIQDEHTKDESTKEEIYELSKTLLENEEDYIHECEKVKEYLENMIRIIEEDPQLY